MTKDTPQVAIITRTKDRPLFLERAIQSIHNQTMHDFVHVIINDAGDPMLVNKLVEKYKELIADRVEVIHNAESHGMESASNKAIKSVKSIYVTIHDDDDTWHPEFLERTTRLLNEQDAMGVVVRADKIVEEVVDTESRIRELKVAPWMPSLKVINLYRQCIDNQMTPITFIYRRNAFEAIGYYDETLPVLGDWDFGIRFIMKYDVEFLDPGFALANYHHRTYKPGVEGNTSYAGNDMARYYTNLLMNKYLRQELADGRLGVGYIMSKLRYDQSNLSAMARRLLPAFVVSRLKKRIQS